MVRIELVSPVTYLSKTESEQYKGRVANIFFAKHPPDINLPVCVFLPLTVDETQEKVPVVQNVIVPWQSVRSIAFIVELEELEETEVQGITQIQL